MARMPANYNALPLGPAARYVGVKPETITKFRNDEMFQQEYIDGGFWYYTFQDLEQMKDRMVAYEESRKRKKYHKMPLDEMYETSLTPSGGVDIPAPCSKVNGTYCKLHEVEHGREDSPAIVIYKDGTSKTFQVRKIDVERDWIFLENFAGNTVAIISAQEVHSITRP